MSKDFITRLIDDAHKKKSHICVGLDPDIKRIPSFIKDQAIERFGNSPKAIGECLSLFSKNIIDAVKDYAIAIKFQIAWFEEHGAWGWLALEEAVKYAKQNEILTIIDVKRGDIGVTANAYARAYLGQVNLWQETKETEFNADAITLNPYLGKDSIDPFLHEMKKNKKGAFVLVKTTNNSSKDIQDVILNSGGFLYEHVAGLVSDWGKDNLGETNSYSNLGAVVAATYPEAATRIRQLMPKAYFLVPGYGAQGGKAEDLAAFFNKDGLGALISASRSIIYAHEGKEEEIPFASHVTKAIIDMRDDINLSLQKANKLFWG